MDHFFIAQTLPLDDTAISARLLAERVSASKLIKQAEALWGSDHALYLEEYLEDVFQATNFDRENPRELFIDYVGNTLVCVTYNKPKGLVGASQEMEIYQFVFAPTYDLSQIQTSKVVTLTMDEIYNLIGQDSILNSDNYPLLGISTYGTAWALKGTKIVEKSNACTMDSDRIETFRRRYWELSTSVGMYTPHTVSMRVSRNRALPIIKSAHSSIREGFDVIERYCKKLGIKPTYYVQPTDRDRTVHMAYSFELMVDPHTAVSVEGFLSVTYRPRVTM